MLEWPNATIYQGLSEIAARDPNAPALVFEGETTTYGELLAEANGLATGLADLGVSAGDYVAVWLGNRPEWVIAQLAASALGAAIVAVNTRYRTYELEYVLEDSGCRLLLTETSFLGNDYLEMLSEIAPEIRTDGPEAFAPEAVPTLESVVALEASDDYPAVRAYGDVVISDSSGEANALDSFGFGEPDSLDFDDNDAPACIFYTSGTTSDPKGCLQSSQSLLNHSHQVGVHLGVGDDDVALGTLPFCGVWGYNVWLSALAQGIPLVIQSHFDPGRAVDLIDEHSVTYLSALATMFHRIMDAERFTPDRVASVERGAIGFISTSYDEALFEAIEGAFGFPLVQPYGLSEANSQVFVGNPTDPIERRKRVGGPLIHPDSEARIVDPDTGETLPAGEEGELRLRGYNVMNGYLEAPDETEAAFDDDGWLHTGDLAIRDEDGSFYFRSRLDDALRVRGFLLAPRDVETAIEEHPDAGESAVVGAPHPRHGQVPVAFVRRADPDLTAADLRAFLDERTADYKVPEDVIFLESFPRSEGPHGRKIRKTELRDRVADRYAGI